MEDKSEMCCNLWAIFDSSTQVIYGYMGKAYALEGSDEAKLEVLRQLSAFDYLTAEAVNLPDRFKLEGPEGTIKQGVTTITAFYDKNYGLFNELFEHIENQLPKIIDYSKETPVVRSQHLSSEPLCVTTLVFEDEMGNRRAIVSEQDREWLEQIGFGSASNTYANNVEIENKKVCEEEEDTRTSIREETKRYFHGHMDMAKAITEGNIYANPPEKCDLCSGSFIDDGFMVDSAIRGQSGWACMCMNCFGRHGQGLGWGVGQLYKNEGKLGWLQVAGFQ